MIKPYWTSSDGNLIIYHGDAREVLPELALSAIDLVLTDPPYGIEGGRGTDNRGRRKGLYLGTAFDDTPANVIEKVLPCIAICLQAVGRVIVTPGCVMLRHYPQWDALGDFFCDVAAGFTPWGYAATNPILYYGKDPRAGKGQSSTGRLFGRSPTKSLDWHPCPKPLADWEWLLCKGSLEGETVLDPFAGAFTTLLAAQRTGRRGIGIEIEEYYCERGAERLQQMPMDLGVTSQVVATLPMELGV